MVDTTHHRRLTYRLYPNETQAQRLKHLKGCHKTLYNALLEQRITRYRRFGETLTYYDQTAEVTALRNADPEELGRADNPWAAMNAQALHGTARRVDRAFDNFFRKVREPSFDGNPGFPRFKSFHRYNGWTYNRQSGWKLSPSVEMPVGEEARSRAARDFVASSSKGGYLELQEVGRLPCRGRARTEIREMAATGELEVKQLTLLDKPDGWYLSVVIACEGRPARRRRADDACGLDWGVSTFATLAVEAAGEAGEAVRRTVVEIANPRLLREAEERLKRLQRRLSRKREAGSHGGNSTRYRKLRSRLARAHQQVARKRKDFLHKVTTHLVEHFALIGTEDLDVLSMTASARGSEDRPGVKVRQKAGLNRSILDTAPGAWRRLLACKAEEAGTRVYAYDPRRFAPTQTCYGCGERVKKTLSDRQHVCGCGVECPRDENAARVLLNLALHGSATGRGPAGRGGGDNGASVPESPPSKRQVHRAA